MVGVINSSTPSVGCEHWTGHPSASPLVGVGLVGWVGVGEGVPCVLQICVRIFIPSAMVLQTLHLHILLGLSIWWLRIRCFSMEVTAAVSLACKTQVHSGH